MMFARACLLALVALPLPAMAQPAGSGAPSPASGAASPTTAAPPAAPAAEPGHPVATATGLGIPEALRGVWFSGGTCTRPDALLFLSARGATRIPAEGAPQLKRFSSIGIAPGGWTLGTVAGPTVPRFALRSPGPERLETVEPAAKTRDDRLPGPGAQPVQWRRCASPPSEVTALHAEGLAALAALEHVEAGCGPNALVRDCLASILAQADVSGDGTLSVAELARMGRGAAWVDAVRAGRPVDARLTEEAGVTAMATARRLIDGLDYDGDGRLSLRELAQDRGSFGGATGTAMGRPLTDLPAVPAMDALRGLVPGVAGTR